MQDERDHLARELDRAVASKARALKKKDRMEGTVVDLKWARTQLKKRQAELLDELRDEREAIRAERAENLELRRAVEVARAAIRVSRNDTVSACRVNLAY